MGRIERGAYGIHVCQIQMTMPKTQGIAMTNKTVIVKDKEHLKALIDNTIKKEGIACDLNFIDVSSITNMRELFAKTRFNGDISKWDIRTKQKIGL